MRVGALYAVLRLEKSQFDAALTTSGGKFAAFAGIVKAGALLAAQAMAAVAAGSLFMAVNFEKHMNEALAIMGDVTPKLRKEMEDAARAVAKTTTFSAAQAADAYYFLASAGYTAQQSIAALPVVAQFAQAGMMDLETATSLLMDTQTTMNLRSDDAQKNMKNMTRVSDVLTAAQVHSNATLQQMAEALINKAGPALRLVNKDIEEGAAVLAVMANQGVKGRVAGTNLAIVLRELQTKAIKNKDTFAELGVAVFDASGNMRNMADIIEDLEDATAGMTDEQEKQVLLDLGFTDRSVGFIQALLGRSDAIREYEALLRDAGGTTQTVAEKQLESFNAKAIIMWHRIQDIALSIGQKLLPGATDIVDAINDWLEANDKLIVQLAGGVIDAIAGMIDKVKTLAGYVGDIAEDIAGMSRTGEGNQSDFFGAWGWLMENAPGIADAFEDVAFWTRRILTNLGNLEDFVGDDTPLGHLAGIVKGINDAFQYFIEEIFPELKGIFEETVGRWIDGWGERVDWFVNEIWPHFVTIWEEFKTNMLPKIEDAFDFIAHEAIPEVGKFIQWLIDEPIAFLMDAFEFMLTWIEDNFPTISAIAEQVFGIFGNAFMIAATLINTWVPIIWAVLEPIATVLLPIIGAALTVLMIYWQIVFTVIGIAVGILRTIVEGFATAVQVAFEIIQGILSLATGDWDGFVEHVQTAINKVLEFLGLIKENEVVIGDPFSKTPKPTVPIGGNAPHYRGPAFASGVQNFGGGWAMVGEQGPELAYLPRGSSVWPSGTGPGGEVTVIATVQQHNVASFGTPAEIRRAAQVLAPAVVEVLRQRGLTGGGR